MNGQTVRAEAICKILEKLLRESEKTGAGLTLGSGLWVFAHALAPKQTARSRHDGLRWLRDALADEVVQRDQAVHVVGFLPKTAYGSFSGLLNADAGIHYLRLPECLDGVPETPNFDQGLRGDVMLRASEERLQELFSAQRHAFGGLAAAVRIYLGMLAAGHAPISDAPGILDAMADEAERQLKGQRPAVDGARVCALVEQRLSRAPARSTTPKIRLAMLDDQVEDHLWDKALSPICVDGVLTSFESWAGPEGLLAGIDSLGNDTVLLLDCNLGQGPDIATGLELLYPIRSRRPELRVVMLSAFDDAPLAIAAMRAGANDYFAKALTDPTDRSSLDYYDRFGTVAQPHSPDGLRVARLWRDFQKAVNGGLELRSDAPNGIPSTLPEQVRLAFFFAFSLLEPNPLARLKVPASSGWPILAALAAEWGRWAPEVPNKAWKNLRNRLMRVRHPRGPISMTTALDCLDYVVKTCWEPGPDAPAAATPGPKLPPLSPYSRDDLQTGTFHPALGGSQRPAPHGDAEVRAASELARGALCCSQCKHPVRSAGDVIAAHGVGNAGRTDYSDLLIIDDKAQSTGLADAFAVAFPGAQIETKAPTIKCLPSLLDKKSAVLLDIHLPTPKEGMRVLRALRQFDAGIPVMAMSASSDVVHPLAFLRAGALGFVSKSLSVARTPQQCREFFLRLRAEVAIARMLGAPKHPCRIAIDLCASLQKWSGTDEGDWWPGVNDPCIAESVEQQARDAGLNDTTLFRPPHPDQWGRTLSDYLLLLSTLHRHMWLLRTETDLKDGLREEGLRRDLDKGIENLSVAIPPFDCWRFEALGLTASGSQRPLSLLQAVIAGGAIDMIARWLWCVTEKKPMAERLWGHSNGINAGAWVRKKLPRAAYRVWQARATAVGRRGHPGDDLDWGPELSESCLADTTKTIEWLLKTDVTAPPSDDPEATIRSLSKLSVDSTDSTGRDGGRGRKKRRDR